MNAARRRQRAGGVHGEGRAIKRARLTREATAGGVVAGASRARNIPARRKVQPGDVVSFRDDAVHAIQLDGLSHIVQWIPPRPARLGEATDPNPDGHWLVPVVSRRDASRGVPGVGARDGDAHPRRNSRVPG